MLDIVFSNGFRETLSPLDQNSVEVRAYDRRGQELFRFTSPLPEAETRMTCILEAIRTRGTTIKEGDDRAAILLSVASKTTGGKVAVAGSDLGQWPELRSELLAIDKRAQLAPSSIRHWLRALNSRKDEGRLDEAFQCGLTALERGHISYIRLMVKDDTLLKRKAASITFAEGRKSEAVEIIERLAQSRLRSVEREWKR
jgi:hypothetical protein